MLFYIIIFFIINYGIYIKGMYGLQILQESSYNINNNYYKWCKKNIKLSFLHLDLISFILVIIAIILKSKLSLVLLVIAIILVIIDTETIRYQSVIERPKDKLKYTLRINLIISIILIIIDLPFVYYLINPLTKYRMILLEFIILIGIDVIIPLVNYLVAGMVYIYSFMESIILKYKLRHLSNLKVVGIVGSYGKSNILNILNEVLGGDILISKVNNKQYNFLFKSIKLLNNDTKYFGVEIGTSSCNEGKFIYKLLRPNYLIVTSDCKNINYFDSNIIYNRDLSSFNKQYLSYGINNKKADIYATSINTNENGTDFKVYFKEFKKAYSFKTKLLGIYNLYNIMAVISYLRAIGMSIKDIQIRVSKLHQQTGYLNVIKGNNVIKINDQSNANPEGIKDALNVLRKFKGLKIIVTPGMINLGGKESYYNEEFGRDIAKYCDYAILIGDKQTKSIQEGLKDVNFDYHKVLVTNDSKEVTGIINNIETNKKKIILYENNLSDIYNE